MMMAAPTNNAHVSESLTQLEAAGGTTVACRVAASFTHGLDIPAIRQCLGEASRQVLETDVTNVVDGFLNGIGQDRPQQAVTKAVQEQCGHEDQVASSCQAVEIATDGLQRIDDQCAQTVAQMCTATARAVDAAKAFAGPVQGALLSQPLVQMATGVVERLLSSRNISLEGMLDVLINDHAPAAQCGSAQTPVCVSSAPDPAPAPTPVDDRDCGCDGQQSVEPAATDCAKPTPVVEEPPAATPECEEGVTLASTPTADPAPCPSTTSSSDLSDRPPVNSHPASSTSAPAPAVVDTSCAGSAQTVVAPAQACEVAQNLNANVNANFNASLNVAASVAGSAVGEFISSMDAALCPPESPSTVEYPTLEPVNNSQPECPEQPVCDEPEPKTEPEPCAEPVGPEPECADNTEPAIAKRPEDVTGEDVPPEGFDKSKQPSVPEGAVTVPDPIEPDSVDNTGQAPAVDESVNDEPVNQVTEVPQQEVQQPAEAAPEPVTPETAPASETWTPDIWVSAGADVDMEVELATSANAVPIARSGQW